MRASGLLPALLLLAGCSGSPPSGGGASTTDPSATGMPTDALTAEAPTWVVGQSWEHNWSFKDPTIGTFDIKTVVAKETDVGMLLGVPDATTAAFHAAFFFPDLGTFSMGNMRVSAGDYSTSWYAFPLSDGKAWSEPERNVDTTGIVQENRVDYVAHLMPKPDGSTSFHVVATIGGNLRALYDYDPAYQWFSEFRYYNATAEADADDPLITIESSLPAYGFAGTVYASTGAPLLQLVSQFGALASPDPMGIQPQGSFTPAPEHDHLLILEFNFAVCGAQTTELIPPPRPTGSNAVYPLVDYDALTCTGTGEGSGSGVELYLPSIAGEWRVVTVGAGAIISGGGLLAYGIHEVPIDVVPAPAPATAAEPA